MPHQKLAEFVRQRLDEGASLAEIETHLRGQKWEEDVIAAVLKEAAPGGVHAASASTSKPPAPRKSWRAWAAAVLVVLLAIVGTFSYRQLSAARAIRALVKHVAFEGRITGQLENSDRTLELVQFRGALDTSDLAAPKAALKLDLDTDGKTGKALKKVSPTTDGRFIATTLIAISTGGQVFGGADLRLAEKNIFFHLDRTPFSGGGNDLMSALIGALAGPKVASNPWVRIPAGPAGTTKTQITWAILFRPTDQVFGSSRELRFIRREPGGDIHGMPTEIHHYVVNGQWLTKELRQLIRETIADKSMVMVGLLQSLATGRNLQDLGSSLDTLTCSDGEMKVWIGKSDTLPRRIILDTKVSEGRDMPLVIALRGEINATYGIQQAIDFPQESVTLDELKKSGILGNFF